MGSQPKHGTADTTLVTQLSAATFPSLLLGRDDEVSLLILQKHAEVTISMQSSHKGLWKVRTKDDDDLQKASHGLRSRMALEISRCYRFRFCSISDGRYG